MRRPAPERRARPGQGCPLRIAIRLMGEPHGLLVAAPAILKRLRSAHLAVPRKNGV